MGERKWQMGEELVPTDVTSLERLPTPEELKAQVDLIQRTMQAVMKQDTHYGVIPGTPKPTLYKAGAEKICLLFGLVPEYDFEEKELPEGHREYTATCKLRRRGTDILMAEGTGVCSTMESKYRYRWDNTGEQVPTDYWKKGRDPAIIGGPSFVPRKAWKDDKQDWYIFRKVEHADPADNYNTCRKIAAKRSYLHATITGTAAGDIFDQDLEDGPENIRGGKANGEPPPKVSRPGRKSAKKKDVPTGEMYQWSGRVKHIKTIPKKEGWKNDLHIIQCEQGMEFSTFDPTHAAQADTAKEAGGKVLIEYSKSEKGGKTYNNVENIEAVSE